MMFNILLIIIFVFALVIHEFSHGFAAYLLGDKTPLLSGRLTLNPFKHIDIFWTIILPFFLISLGIPAIGIAKPVPINFYAFSNPRRDITIVALAGPFSNLVMAFIYSLFFRNSGLEIFLIGAYINSGIGLFNLIPILPLDGGRVFAALLPPQYAHKYYKLEPYGIFIIFLLLWVGILGRVIIFFINLYLTLIGLPLI